MVQFPGCAVSSSEQGIQPLLLMCPFKKASAKIYDSKDLFLSELIFSSQNLLRLITGTPSFRLFLLRAVGFRSQIVLEFLKEGNSMKVCPCWMLDMRRLLTLSSQIER